METQNETLETIEIDDVSPASHAMLFDLRQDFILKHGGVATRVHFDTVERMGIGAFLEHEVPKLRDSGADKQLYVLRDSVTQSVSIIYGNQVLKYNVKHIEDAPIDDIVTLLKKDEDICYYPNIKYPIIGHVEGKTRTAITVLLENKNFIFRSNTYPGGKFEIPCYLPPVWFQVMTNKSHALLGVKVAAVPESSVDCLTSALCALPLPNVFESSAEICLGSTHIKISDAVELTDGVVVQSAIDQVFTSLWNDHLIHGKPYEDIVGTSYRQCTSEHKKRIEKRLKDTANNRALSGLLRMLCVMSEPNGWRLLKFPSLGKSAREFLT